MLQKANWKDLFTGKLSEHGFGQADITTIYAIEMELRSFFEFGGVIPNCLRLQNIERDAKRVDYYWISESYEAVCPQCGTLSSRDVTGDYYNRYIQDIPYAGIAVYHIVRSKRFRCLNEDCPCGKFIERFYEFVDESASKTRRFKDYCVERSLGCGCNHAQHEIRAEGGIVSNDSIGRYLKARASGVIKENMTRDDVKVISIDDVNLRKGDKSTGCTVFIDEESHKILIIVRGTTKEAAKRVMEMFPSAEFLSRDRASSYASAGAELGKTQVADRFHLIQNAQQAVKDALMANVPASILIRDGDGWVQMVQPDRPGGGIYHTIPNEIVEERIRLAGLSPAKALKYRETVKLIELADKGLRTADIAEAMGVPYKRIQSLRRTAANTIRDVEDKIRDRIEKSSGNEESSEKGLELPGARAEKTVGGPRVQPARQSIVEPYRETVIALWKAGGNHRSIYPELQAQGYAGSANAIYQYILKLGKESPDVVAREKKPVVAGCRAGDDFDLALAQDRPEISLESVARDSVYKAVLKEASRTRPAAEADEKTKKGSSKPWGSRPASSPFSDEIMDLIYGPENTDEQEPTSKCSKKNCN